MQVASKATGRLWKTPLFEKMCLIDHINKIYILRNLPSFKFELMDSRKPAIFSHHLVFI